ncbi:type IV fimbrial biogenesis protein FimT [Photobacterium aphoticum]|uniref:Type II secretion system protein H n=1 Tax=Photobacterium aphoticum TaxID=754436 RepID=A0A090QMJ5_9GAMM|nr:type IV fimbrial biogenesis protein FimT [Photobacterium aphoticum]
MAQRKQGGFTILELFVTISIVCILAAVALPSFSSQVKNERIVTNANQLHSVVKFARGEAAKRAEQINLVVLDTKWLVKIHAGTPEEETLAEFMPSHPSVSISNLRNMTVSKTGAMPTAQFIITDGDSQTADRYLCVFSSGQSVLKKEASCL